jgi:hypothetical protein
MKNIDDLKNRIITFRDARDWKQFHNHIASLDFGWVSEGIQKRYLELMEEFIR